MPRNAWMTLSALALTILLAACATGNTKAPIVIVPTIPPYSVEFQNKLADEMEANGLVPCPPDFLVPDCSAWRRAVIDYGYLREQIRVVD